MQNHPVLYYLKYQIKLEILSVNNIKLLSSILLAYITNISISYLFNYFQTDRLDHKSQNFKRFIFVSHKTLI